MGVDNYEERYCLFLDILGFQDHIDSTIPKTSNSKQTMTFSRLRSALAIISEGVNYKEHVVGEDGEKIITSRRVTQFSDSVIISYRKNEKSRMVGVSSMLLDVHRLQLQLINMGILLRGAITSGLLFHDKEYVFGPALNDAVTLERLANYPRVILDGEILKEAGLKSTDNDDNSRTISSMITEDFDGLFYVDYFDIHPDDFNEEWSEIRCYFENLRKLIKSLANKRSLSIKVKHSWLRTKFNNVVTSFMKSGFKKLGHHDVPEDEIQLFIGLKPF